MSEPNDQCHNCGYKNGSLTWKEQQSEIERLTREAALLRGHEAGLTRSIATLTKERDEAREAARHALEAFDIVTQNDVLANMTVESLRADVVRDRTWLEEVSGE